MAFSTGSVPPASCRNAAIARGPSTTAATSGPPVMNSSRLLEERLALVLGVVLLGELALDRAQFERDHVEALALDPGQDLADQLAPDTVGLDQDQGSFGHERSVSAASAAPHCSSVSRNRSDVRSAVAGCRPAPAAYRRHTGAGIRRGTSRITGPHQREDDAHRRRAGRRAASTRSSPTCRPRITRPHGGRCRRSRSRRSATRPARRSPPRPTRRRRRPRVRGSTEIASSTTIASRIKDGRHHPAQPLRPGRTGRVSAAGRLLVRPGLGHAGSRPNSARAVPGRDHRAGDDHAGSRTSPLLLGELAGLLDRLVHPPADVHPLRAEHRRRRARPARPGPSSAARSCA